jgi:tRNA G10  N-methylase Trm11
MLPPKLAQIIINLSGNNITRREAETKGFAVAIGGGPQATLLDPFCGTGVILQEALLAGFNAYGTDLEPRMVDYSLANLEWLASNQKITGSYKMEVGDATNATWQHFDGIAGETYLGRPFSAQPDPAVLQEVMQDVNHIHKKFLQNVARQTQPGFRMCIAVPAWKTSSGFKHLKTLDILEELGYNRIEFVHARTEDLIYHREGQVVARELVVLTRK